ncbi:MAG: restriction endonuclease subunit R, partial [Cyanobacteria bacterium P01_A01_bin.105]
MQVLQASHLRLHDVQTKFGLQETRATDFFLEWQVNRLPLSEVERYWLDKAQNSIRYLSAYPLREELVKMVVLSPVLSVA